VPLLSPFFTSEEALLIAKKKEERAQSTAQQQTVSVAYVTKKEGLCEACNLKFSDLEEHRSTEKHRQFGANDANWVEIDAILAAINDSY
jgi:regulatory subunit for Cdc7p protein kinase